MGGGIVRYNHGIGEGKVTEWLEGYEKYWRGKGEEGNAEVYRRMREWMKGGKRKFESI